jgi:hypothetical protein
MSYKLSVLKKKKKTGQALSMSRLLYSALKDSSPQALQGHSPGFCTSSDLLQLDSEHHSDRIRKIAQLSQGLDSSDRIDTR